MTRVRRPLRVVVLVLVAAAGAAAVLVWLNTRPGGPAPASAPAADTPASQLADTGGQTPEQPADSDEDLVSPELADLARPSPLEPAVFAAADDAAVAFVLAYTTRSWDETAEERDARLAPMLTDHARSWLAGGSSAAAERADQQQRREHTTAQLASSQPIDVSPQAARFLVVVAITTSDDRGAETVSRAYTVTVTSADQWLVDDLAPANPSRP